MPKKKVNILVYTLRTRTDPDGAAKPPENTEPPTESNDKTSEPTSETNAKEKEKTDEKPKVSGSDNRPAHFNRPPTPAPTSIHMLNNRKNKQKK